MLRLLLAALVFLFLSSGCSTSERAEDGIVTDYAPDPGCDEHACVARCREVSSSAGMCTWRGCECAEAGDR